MEKPLRTVSYPRLDKRAPLPPLRGLLEPEAGGGGGCLTGAVPLGPGGRQPW